MTAPVQAPPREQTRARSPDEDGVVERDGVRVFYEAYGDGTPTFLLLPTWSIVHSRVWKAQIPYLARHGRVVTFDGRGNGRSDRPQSPEAYTPFEFAADALAVLDAAAVERAVLVSLSIGAQRALVLAAEHPERVAGSVFVAPTLELAPGHPERAVYPFEDELDTDEGWALFNVHAWRRDYPGFLAFFFSRMFTEPHSTKQIEDCVGWGLETDPETLTAATRNRFLTEAETRALCARVRCPVLVVHGDDDAISPHARGAALAEATGGGLVTLHGAGHGPVARDPVRLNLVIREFAGSLR